MTTFKRNIRDILFSGKANNGEKTKFYFLSDNFFKLSNFLFIKYKKKSKIKCLRRKYFNISKN